MARKKIDLTGQRFGRLTAIKATDERMYGESVWVCVCDCGNEVKVKSSGLRNGKNKSCGCLRDELSLKRIKNAMESPNYKAYMEKDSIEKGTRLSLIQPERVQSNNLSGVTGVYYHKRNEVWVAKLILKKETKLYKEFKHKQDAINARKEAEEKYFEPILEKYDKK